jgi:E3 ubiquitin-protein ligase RNF144
MEPSQQPTPPVVVKQEPIRNQDNSPSPVFENPESSIIDRKPKSCGICFIFKTDSNMFKGKSCNHNCCVDCISQYVVSEINNKVVKVYCPIPNCFVKLKRENLQHILPKETSDKWELAKYVSKIELEQKTYCPFKNCSVLLVNDGGEVVTSCECPFCHRLFCAQCKVPWHANMTCGEFRKSRRVKVEPGLDAEV